MACVAVRAIRRGVSGDEGVEDCAHGAATPNHPRPHRPPRPRPLARRKSAPVVCSVSLLCVCVCVLTPPPPPSPAVLPVQKTNTAPLACSDLALWLAANLSFVVCLSVSPASVLLSSVGVCKPPPPFFTVVRHHAFRTLSAEANQSKRMHPVQAVQWSWLGHEEHGNTFLMTFLLVPNDLSSCISRLGALLSNLCLCICRDRDRQRCLEVDSTAERLRLEIDTMRYSGA